MAQDQIAGVQVAVVGNGETLLVKGYGIDSVEPRRAVDPNQSLFRIGSISKTFTWLSIMQLAERGQLKLDDPINDHLPDELDVPDEGFEQPIRIVDLMNHTAGFEDILQGLFVAAGRDAVVAARATASAPAASRPRARQVHGVFELQHCTRGRDRRASLRHGVRELRRAEHPGAARSRAHDVPRAIRADGRSAAADVSGSCRAHGAEHRDAQWRVAGGPTRAHRLDGACGRSGFNRSGHGALHARVARPAAARSSGRAQGRHVCPNARAVVPERTGNAGDASWLFQYAARCDDTRRRTTTSRTAARRCTSARSWW